jgi:microcystin-dependent protein
MAQPYVGEIRMFAGNFAPAGWMFCEGQLLPISENETLFNLIGTTYGGDGESTFGLPDLRGRVPVHQGPGPGIPAAVALAESAGVEQVTLTVQQIPGHTHPLLVNGSAGRANSPDGRVLASSPTLDLYREAAPSVALATVALTQQGGSQPHTNQQPYLCVDFIISLFGIFPSQT